MTSGLGGPKKARSSFCQIEPTFQRPGSGLLQLSLENGVEEANPGLARARLWRASKNSNRSHQACAELSNQVRNTEFRPNFSGPGQNRKSPCLFFLSSAISLCTALITVPFEINMLITGPGKCFGIRNSEQASFEPMSSTVYR